MKLQGLSIIFTLICIPLLLVLSYYLSLQVDTIRLQNQYDTKLLDATYDALSTFELNTANEDLSTVSDSLRTIIDASNSIFFNTLATNMGLSNASKSYVEPYIPAILYPLYDGYYIYSPTSVPEVATSSDGTAIKVGDDGVTADLVSNLYSYEYNSNNPPEQFESNSSNKYYLKEDDYGQLLFLTNDSKKSNSGTELTYSKLTTNVDTAKKSVKSVLKSYMPYSARYVGNYDSNYYDYTIIYTLDNYLTVEGYTKFGGSENKKVYYTESGYLLNSSSINFTGDDILSYNQNTAQEMIEDRKISFGINIGDVSIDMGSLQWANHLIDKFSRVYDPVNTDPKDNKLKVLTINNVEDWNKKTEIQKYESLMTILKNKATEYEETIRYRKPRV